MSVYSLIGMASYSASIGYGITTAAVGIILTCTRILDGITDPLLAFVYDRVNTKFGKLRVLLIAGYLIEAVALYAMFTGFSSKGMGLVTFTLLYVVYVIGYTTTNMTAQTIPAIMTNDPRQRPTLGVWTTAFNYLVPMVMSMVLNVVLLPKCGGTYNQAISDRCLQYHPDCCRHRHPAGMPRRFRLRQTRKLCRHQESRTAEDGRYC